MTLLEASHALAADLRAEPWFVSVGLGTDDYIYLYVTDLVAAEKYRVGYEGHPVRLNQMGRVTVGPARPQLPGRISHILLDMDGVMANFVEGACHVHGRGLVDLCQLWPVGEYSIEGVMGLTSPVFWAGLDAAGVEFWRDLSPYPWLKELWAMLQNYGPITISSSPSHGAYAAAGKVLWLRQHIEAGFRDYMFGSAKHLLAAPGRVLIDDSDEKCQQFQAHGGHAIVFPQRWNSCYAYCGDRLSYVHDRLEELRQDGHGPEGF